MLKKLLITAVLMALLSLPVTAFASEGVVGHSCTPAPIVSTE